MRVAYTHAYAAVHAHVRGPDCSEHPNACRCKYVGTCLHPPVHMPRASARMPGHMLTCMHVHVPMHANFHDTESKHTSAYMSKHMCMTHVNAHVNCACLRACLYTCPHVFKHISIIHVLNTSQLHMPMRMPPYTSVPSLGRSPPVRSAHAALSPHHQRGIPSRRRARAPRAFRHVAWACVPLCVCTCV